MNSEIFRGGRGFVFGMLVTAVILGGVAPTSPDAPRTPGTSRLGRDLLRRFASDAAADSVLVERAARLLARREAA